jgi:prepilin-type N-terminal cleavage/methylation domain-containing protein
LAGFTLFELLVSISIIAILTVLASISYSAAQKKARDSRRMQDIKSIQTAAEQYYSLHSASYPVSSGISSWNGVFEIFPTDAKSPTDSYTYSPITVAGADYCACAKMEVSSGNSSSATCGNFGTATAYFCVKNQQ